jgi:hypothetical protein
VKFEACIVSRGDGKSKNGLKGVNQHVEQQKMKVDQIIYADKFMVVYM